jgi:hypothetical protein
MLPFDILDKKIPRVSTIPELKIQEAFPVMPLSKG